MPSSTLPRRSFLMSVAGAFAGAGSGRAQSSRKPPNIVLLLADDLGYGDVGCYGSPIPTPNIDSLAVAGTRLTRFYAAAPVCSPSRAAFLTGRYPARTGVVNVLMPSDGNGLKNSELTIPKLLKQQGYRSACVGKWHLGDRSQFMPPQHGFDEFYGLPYSNDMNPLPVIRDSQTLTADTDQDSLTDQFTDQAVDFIVRNRETPFFLYLAYTAPHIPIWPAQRFRGKSGHGSYGDIVNELDWSVGQVLAALRDNGLEENTLVIFTSDNGPWYQGSAGSLQGRKGSTMEGGVREPFVARLPGRIPAGQVAEGVASAMDLMPTFARLAGIPIQKGAVDGVDLWPMLSGEATSLIRDPLLFFDGWNIQAVRWGPWKLHLARYNSFPWTQDPPGGRMNLPLPHPELYQIDEDPGETLDLADENPDVVNRLRSWVESMLAGMPAEVRNAWKVTNARRVQETPAGALPRLEGN